MATINSVAVFCGSSPGNHPKYLDTAQILGNILAEKSIRLIYGGGNMGIMGQLARAVMAGGGQAIGVIPQRLNAMVHHTDLSELMVVPGMHERKQRMYDLADAFIILPGGIGTMEEFFEVFTWQQLGYHQKPVILLNIQEFFAPLLGLLDQLVGTGFLKPAHRQALLVASDLPELIVALQAWQPTYFAKLPERNGNFA